MSINLLKSIQQNLDYPSLQKIDPNTQEVKEDESTPDEHKFSQAVIPAILAAFYIYVQADKGAAGFLESKTNEHWIEKIFTGNKKEVLEAITSYTNQSGDELAAEMNVIANEVVKLVKENLSDHAGIKEVKSFFKIQINNVLLYLPAALKMGELLDDNTLDDNTHKMEGPISSLGRSFGTVFSNASTEEDTGKYS